MRLRRADSQWLITVKGPASTTEYGAMERREIEAPWSVHALGDILREFDFLYVTVPGKEPGAQEPIETVLQSGLEIVHHRVTHRGVRNVVPKSQEIVVAELVIDRVAYVVAGIEIVHHEIEIESKDRLQGPSVIHRMSEELLVRFSGDLRLWRCGKLATGRALEELWRRGILDVMINEDRTLKPRAYDEIERYLD